MVEYKTVAEKKAHNLALKKYLINGRDKLMDEHLKVQVNEELSQEEKDEKSKKILLQLKIFNDIIGICDERNRY